MYGTHATMRQKYLFLNASPKQSLSSVTPPFHSMQVARSRTVLFAVFLFIPGGLIRSLSKKTTDVGDNESECNLQHVPITTV